MLIGTVHRAFAGERFFKGEGGRGRKEREWVDERERMRTQRRRSRAALHHHATHKLLTPIPSGAASDATMQRRKGRVGGRERRKENVEEAVCVWSGGVWKWE